MKLAHKKNIDTRSMKFILMTLLCVFQMSFIWAQVPKSDLPPTPNPPRLVNDLAGIMDPQAVIQLEKELVDFDNTQSTQIAVVTVRSIGSYEIAQYATDLAHEWGIGRKGKDNGVLLLVAVNDRKVNISTGYGTEGAITDGTAGSIIRNEITPAFQRGDYTSGIIAGVNAIKKALDGEYVNDKKQAEDPTALPIGIIIFIVIFMIIVIIGAGGRGGGGGGRNGEYMSRRGDDFLTGAILGSLLGGGRGSGGFGGGFGGFGGGGDFGGFGGGGFGGGGASGSW